MSRAGYSEDYDNWELIMWRGQVASAIRGKRGQALLKEMLEALDAMPTKRLIAEDLINDGGVCALGAVGARRGVDLVALDPENHPQLAKTFNVAEQLIREIEWINDEAGFYKETPEKRWERVRAWVVEKIKP